MNDEDLEEEEASDGRILNGATLRVALALRNTVLSNTNPKSGTINPDLRVVLQMSEPSNFVDAVCFTGAKGNEVILPMDLNVFLNTLLFKSASQPGLAR